MTTPTLSSTPYIKTLDANAPDFDAQLAQLQAYPDNANDTVREKVRGIIQRIKTEGDVALRDLTERFDAVDFNAKPASNIFEIPKAQLKEAFETLEPEVRQALIVAKERITAYHQQQLEHSWMMDDPQMGASGGRLGQRVQALQRVALYVPGGKASYPSSVLMNAIPAKVAGVRETIMLTPTPKGEYNPTVLAAAHWCEIDRVFGIGGAQAVAAVAYGTASIPRVDKIVGPGNAWVAEAKRQVFGLIGIDMVAGPSEVVIINDGSGQPDWVAADMMAQAEHDEWAQSILLSTDKTFIAKVEAAIGRLITQMPRRPIIAKSLAQRGAYILVSDIPQAINIANRLAPEHLELSVNNPESWIDSIHAAGAIFCGHHSCEVLGDYCAGTNHVLPTSGSARFSSPLSVYDFIKRTAILNLSPQSVHQIAPHARVLAEKEGLFAHALAAQLRQAP